MAPLTLYTICVLGAVALYMMLRPGSATWKAIGVLLGIATFGWLMAGILDGVGEVSGSRPGVLFMVFAAISVGAAVRMITHSRPVYAALHFVLVVISSAAMYLLLDAEFMAFALIIVYAGAILITYMFVIMLAQQAPQADNEQGQPEYDRVPREPAAAAIVGFVLLALLTTMVTQGISTLPSQPNNASADRLAWTPLDDMPRQLDAVVEEMAPGATIQRDANGRAITVVDGNAFVTVSGPEGDGPVVLPEEAMPKNTQRVGLALVMDFPASLEVAGVILLMAMFGAVVLARKQIELGEAELREAAGITEGAE